MREIKFRAWDRIEKHMRYGFKVGEFASFQHCEPFQQFTGLKDKNGKEIYEGDILRGCPSGYIPEKRTLGKLVEVVFCEAGKGYSNNPKCGWYIKDDDFTMIQVWMHVCGCGYEEVISNIYENPELLKHGN